MAFGRGLVPTAEDFGSQGQMPSHPELLDWLATTFVKSGWNAKAVQKLIVTSAAYRQSSLADAQNWFGSDVRRTLMEEATALLVRAETVSTLSGLELWFDTPPGRRPLR